MATRRTVTTLTLQQRKWAESYLMHGNATRAARDAGYSYPDKAGAKLKANEKVQDFIEDALRELVMSRNEVLIRLSQQARNEATHYLTQSGTFDLQKMQDDGNLHLLHARETPQGAILEPHNAQTALIYIGKHYKLFAERFELSDELNNAINEALDIISKETAVSL